jgi:hypothetical protein
MVTARTVREGAMILIEAHSDGSTSRLTRAFRSLDDATIENLVDNGAVALSYIRDQEAFDDYELLCRECNEDSGLIGGTIALYRNGTMEHSWDIVEGHDMVPFLISVSAGFDNRRVFTS